MEKPKIAVAKFITLHAPDKTTTSLSDLLFVRQKTAPTDTNSFFVQALALAQDDVNFPSPTDKRVELHTLAQDFISSTDWMENDFPYPHLFELEQFLVNKQKKLTKADILSQASKLLGASDISSDTNKVWDNFFVCVVEDYDIHYRQQVKSLLKVDFILQTLDNFADEPTSEQIQQLIRAEVLMPKFPYDKFVVAFEQETKATPFKKTSERLAERGAYLAAYEKAQVGLRELAKFEGKIQAALQALQPDSTEYATLAANQGKINTTTGVYFDNTEEAMTFLATELNLSTPIDIEIAEAKDLFKEKATSSFSNAMNTVSVTTEVIKTGGSFWAKNPDYLPSEKPIPPGDYLPNGSLYKDFYHNGRECNPMPFLIADLMVINQEVCCYEENEISHIENVMATETRSNTTKRSTTIDETLTRITDRTKEEEKDRQSTERNELQSTISSMLSESLSMSFTANLHAVWGPVAVDSGFGYSENSASTNAQESSRNFAKELVERASSKVTERVMEERITRTIRTFEEENVHSFNNAEGDKHIVGIYRWMDKIIENTTTNLGQRLMLELFVPEPAAFHFYALAAKAREGQLAAVNTASTLQAPLDPTVGFDYTNPNNTISQWKLNRFSDLNEENFMAWAQKYGAEVKLPPEEFIYATNSITNTIDQGKKGAFDCSMDIPQGYFPTAISYSFAQDTGTVDMWFMIGTNATMPNLVTGVTEVIDGAFDHPLVKNHTSHSAIFPTGTLTLTEFNIVGKLPITVFGSSLYFGLNLVLKCHRTSDTFKKWQAETYQSIMSAYKRLKDAYDVALAAQLQSSQAGASYGFGGNGFAYQSQNPTINREIERTELKRSAIYYLNGGKLPSPENLWNDPYPIDEDNEFLPEFSYCSNIINTPYIKFMESAFDWKNMTYQFFPYFYARKSQWVNLYLQQDADQLFANFLKAGYAKVLIPVQPGREKDVLAFMSSGNVFTKATRELEENPLVKDILAHFINVKPTTPIVSEPWLTRVPTSLICLQNDASPLDSNALDCHCEEKEGVPNPDTKGPDILISPVEDGND
jgi:hypothetical protein